MILVANDFCGSEGERSATAERGDKVVKMDAGISGFNEVNKLGKEGWELVAVIPKTEFRITNTICFIFKREMRSKKGVITTT